jgi:hypothetical protein
MFPRHELSVVIVRHGDDDFAPSVSLSEIPERFRELIQRVLSIDDGHDLASSKKLAHKDQVPVILAMRQVAHLLAPGS